MKEYTKEDMKTDLAWFDGIGVDEEEARSFIKYLLGHKLKEEGGMYNILDGFGTNKEEFETFVGRQPRDEEEMSDWIHYLENGANAQLDWGIICQEASEHFSKEEE